VALGEHHLRTDAERREHLVAIPPRHDHAGGAGRERRAVAGHPVGQHEADRVEGRRAREPARVEAQRGLAAKCLDVRRGHGELAGDHAHHVLLARIDLSEAAASHAPRSSALATAGSMSP